MDLSLGQGKLHLRNLATLLDQSATAIDADAMRDILARLTISLEDIQPHTQFSERRYARNLVKKTPEYEIMIMCWNSGQRSSIHDHAGSLGGLKVLSGMLTESMFERAPNGMIKSQHSTDHGEGAMRVEEAGLIHQISNLQVASQQAISVHIYVPPLTRMNVYSLEDASVKNILPQYFSFGSGI